MIRFVVFISISFIFSVTVNADLYLFEGEILEKSYDLVNETDIEVSCQKFCSDRENFINQMPGNILKLILLSIKYF